MRPPSADHSDDGPDRTAWRRLFPAKTIVRTLPNLRPCRPRPECVSRPTRPGPSSRKFVEAYNGALDHQLGRLAGPPSLAAFAVKQGALQGAASATPLGQFLQFIRQSEKAGTRYRSDPAEMPADFHQIVASLGTYPRLLRRLGLVLDLELPADRLGLDGADPGLRLSVQPMRARSPRYPARVPLDDG